MYFSKLDVKKEGACLISYKLDYLYEYLTQRGSANEVIYCIIQKQTNPIKRLRVLKQWKENISAWNYFFKCLML